VATRVSGAKTTLLGQREPGGMCVPSEQPVQFQNHGQTLRGILHSPGTSSGGTQVRRRAVVFLHGWSGCRLGPHRMFVAMARQLTTDGFHALRFDFRGRGESDGQQARTSIHSMVSDAIAAAHFLLYATPAERIVLLGICSGGKVAMASAADIPFVADLALWSCEPLAGLGSGATPWRKTLKNLTLYSRKMLHIRTWRKFFSGSVNAAMVGEALWSSERPDRDELAWEKKALAQFGRFRGRILFVHGTADPGATPADLRYRRFCRTHGIDTRHHAVPGANHSFYSLPWARETMQVTREWLVGDTGLEPVTSTV
jgi:uncharacterized protein